MQTLDQSLENDLSAAVDYVFGGPGSFLQCSVDNQEQLHISAWLFQKRSTEANYAITGKRFYVGDDRAITRSFKLGVLPPGLVEEIKVQVFDHDGELLLETAPLINQNREE